MQLLDATYSALKTTPTKQPVLLTEAACVTKADREKMTEIMFEKFNVPSMFLADQSTLSLYAAGRLNGITLSSGHGVTQIVVNQNGNPIHTVDARVDLAGLDLTNYLTQLVGNGIDISKATEIKEKDCSVALNYATEAAAAPEKSYTLPDGKTVTLKSELLKCPEAFFQPDLIGQGEVNIPQMICDAATKAAADNGMEVSTLYSNFVLSGGNTCFRGMPERITKEVQALAPANTKVNVCSNPLQAINSTFFGGSILVCLDDFQPMWATRAFYDEQGVAGIHKKFV